MSSGLHYNASEHPLFIVVDPFFYNEQLFKLTELAFEKLGFPAIYFMKSSSCIGYSPLSSSQPSFSLGKTTCLSMDFGASGIRVVPVFDGYSLMMCTLSTELRASERRVSLRRELPQPAAQ